MTVAGGLAALTLSVAGCGTEGPQPVPVSGVSTHNGKPLRALVFFVPDEDAPPADNSVRRGARATSDGQGRFELGTLGPGDGAFPGEYKVAIGTIMAPPMPDGVSGRIGVVESPWPNKYNTALETSLTATVTREGPNEVIFDVTDE